MTIAWMRSVFVLSGYCNEAILSSNDFNATAAASAP